MALFGYISNYIASLYVKNNIIPPEHKEVYRGGVELILNEAFTFVLVILLSAIFFKIRYGIEFLVTMCITRVYCGGFHAETTFVCRLTMLLTSIAVFLISNLLVGLSQIYIFLILAVSFIGLLPLIPVRHPNKNLTKELISKNRRRGIMSFLFFSAVSVALYQLDFAEDSLVIVLSLTSVTALAVLGTLMNKYKYDKLNIGGQNDKDCNM